MDYKDTITASEVTEPGTIVADYYDEGVRVLIMRAPASFCVYLGVPSDHPLAGFPYDDLNIDCHGGLTFAGEGGLGRGKAIWPVGFYWYGYDYAHAGDKTVYDHLPEFAANHIDERDWTLGEIKTDAWKAIYDFKKLMKLAENIKKK